MLDTKQMKEYRKMRKEGMSASQAYRYSKQPANKPVDWYNDEARIEKDGKAFIARLKTDNDCDLSYLGEFSDKWQPGAVHHSNSSSKYKWFIPCTTYAEHYKSLLKMKVGKAEADRLARQYVADCHRLLNDYGVGWWTVSVAIYLQTDTGEEFIDSIGGVESDSGECIDSLVYEMIDTYLVSLKREPLLMLH